MATATGSATAWRDSVERTRLPSSLVDEDPDPAPRSVFAALALGPVVAVLAGLLGWSVGLAVVVGAPAAYVLGAVIELASRRVQERRDRRGGGS
jgi:hypothetical protein